FVPDSVVLHRYHGSSERHGSAWLIVTSRTNRLRTLLKNASWGFLLKTAPTTVRDMAMVTWYGRNRGGADLWRAARDSLAQRERVRELATRRRADIERDWVRI